MAVGRNRLNKLKPRAAAGSDECLMVFADQGFVVETIVVRIQPRDGTVNLGRTAVNTR